MILGTMQNAEGFVFNTNILQPPARCLMHCGTVSWPKQKSLAASAYMKQSGEERGGVMDLKQLPMTKYAPLFLAGGLCAMITHGLTVPIDLIKTQNQVGNSRLWVYDALLGERSQTMHA
jgi:hypothetical protein